VHYLDNEEVLYQQYSTVTFLVLSKLCVWRHNMPLPAVRCGPAIVHPLRPRRLAYNSSGRHEY